MLTDNLGKFCEQNFYICSQARLEVAQMATSTKLAKFLHFRKLTINAVNLGFIEYRFKILLLNNFRRKKYVYFCS